LDTIQAEFRQPREAIKVSVKELAVATAVVALSFTIGPRALSGDQAPPAPEASPDVYQVIAENDQWRVMQATWQPGQEDNLHSHPADRVSLFTTDCALRLTKADGSFRDANPKAGKAKVRTGEAEPAHTAKNIGDNVCTMTIVELK
jgi:hypothetical protein